MRTKYDVIFENLQEKVTNGELTMEDAMKVNDLAYKKYGDIVIEEGTKDPEDLLDELEDLVKDGKVTLTDDDIKVIKEIIKRADDGEKKEEPKEEPSEEKKEEETPAEEPAAEDKKEE